MNSFSATGATCIAKPKSAPLSDLVLPFDAQTLVVCTHSSGVGSHSGENAYFALDLANHYEEPAATIRAAGDGTAFVFLAANGQLCPEPKGAPSASEPSDCGDSWGNRVKILHAGGLFSFYAHLDHPLVKTGDKVRRGDPIGVMGWTGAAGHRHLHWSLQRLPGVSETEWIQRISWMGQSIPFDFSARARGVEKKFDAGSLRCPHAGIGADGQPEFRGVH